MLFQDLLIKKKTMKNHVLTSFLLAIVLSSCCKTRTCECVNNESIIEEIHTSNASKKAADEWCDDWDTFYKDLNKGKCTLKK